MYKTESLLKEFCPTIYGMIKKSKTNWEKLDKKFEEDYLKEGIEVESNIAGILLKAKLGDKFLIEFLRHADSIAKYLYDFTKEKRKFRDIIVGKFTNLDSLNYLNPIGELSFLKKMIDNSYELIRIEDNQTFPKLTPKDFLLKSPSGSELLIEVVNIHLRDDYESTEDLKMKLLNELNEKIEKETKGMEDERYPSNFFFQPILWHVNLSKFKKHVGFFKDFSKSVGRDFGLKYNTLGFCTFGKTKDNNLLFGEVSSFYDKYEIE
ncbi:MAG: hypothetical protein AB8H03_22980 [Saprospiraceae bacterium]